MLNKKESSVPEEKIDSIALGVEELFSEESGPKNINNKKSKKPGLDYYDNMLDEKADGSSVSYQGRYGKSYEE